jgi:hypothetical protein
MSKGSSATSGPGMGSYLDAMKPAAAPAPLTVEEQDKALEAKVEASVEILAEKAAEQAAESVAEDGMESL